MNAEDRLCMQRAFELGERGRLFTAPNPHVGCVIAVDGQVIAEGWHHRAGERHAEVHALSRIPAGWQQRLNEATAYVTLEPCAHQGRTPPCADALLQAGIGRVVAAITDPSDWVAGTGMERLQEGGVATEWCGKEFVELAEHFNRRFLTAKNRPWVVLKWAESADGLLAPTSPPRQVAITSSWAQRLTHRWRAQEQGILVGHSTWKIDQPRLDVRAAPGNSPQRFVWAPSHLRNAPEDVWWITGPELVRGARDLAWEPMSGVQGLLQIMHTQAGIQSILVEGGGQTLQAFIDEGCWDECKWFVADAPLNEAGIAAPKLELPSTSWMESGRGPSESWYRCIRSFRKLL